MPGGKNFLRADVAQGHGAPMNKVASSFAAPVLTSPACWESTTYWLGIRPNGSEIPSLRCRDGNSPSGSISPCRRLSTVRAGSGAIPLVTQ
jgi:hypothetical protein